MDGLLFSLKAEGRASRTIEYYGDLLSDEASRPAVPENLAGTGLRGGSMSLAAVDDPRTAGLLQGVAPLLWRFLTRPQLAGFECPVAKHLVLGLGLD